MVSGLHYFIINNIVVTTSVTIFQLLLFILITHNSLCMWSARLKVMNFQNRAEPIRLLSISCFPSIIKEELAVLQQRAAVQKTAETRITYDTLLGTAIIFIKLY